MTRPVSIVCLSLALFVGCNRNRTTNLPSETTATGQPAAAPSGKDAAQRDTALVRIVDVDPSIGAVDIWFENRKVFSNVGYKGVTPYDEVSAEQRHFFVKPAGQDSAQPLAENDRGPIRGKHYTLVIMHGKDGKPVIHSIDDDLVPPSAGKAKVRVINAGDSTGDIAVYESGKNDALFGDVNKASASGYKDVDPSTTSLE